MAAAALTCAAAPISALAKTFTSVGYMEGGGALEGLVTIHGKTYCYVGGEKVTGRHTVGGKERYFWPDDGHMAVSEPAEVDGTWEFYSDDGSRAAGWRRDGDDWYWVAEDGSAGAGWLSHNGKWYLLDDSGRASTGWQLVDGEWYWLDRDSCAMATGVSGGDYFDESGHWRARNEGGWDFTDWGIVQRAVASAAADGSSTGIYVYVEWLDPVREVVCRLDADSGKWHAVAGWYCSVGRKRISDGVPRGCAGTFEICAKWPESDTGPGRCLDYIGVYEGGAPSAWGNNSASFHGGMESGQWGYSMHSCVATTYDHAQWLYDNVPIGTRIRNVGPMYGYDNADDSNLQPDEVHQAAIESPFA